MRGYFILLGIFMWIPILIFKPHVGILVWNWISHMVPQGNAPNIQHLPLLDSVAVLTLAGLFISKEPRKMPMHPIFMAMLIFYVWTIFTTIFAGNPGASGKFVHLTKILFFVTMTVIVMQSPLRLRAYYWIMGLSMAFYAIKGGLFLVITGGAGIVKGGGGMLADRNQLAMALSMTIPIAYYLYLHPPHRLLKLPMLGSVVLTFLSVIGTQSRGGLIAGLSVMGMLFLNVKKKMLVIGLTVPLLFLGYQFLPDHIKNRYQTIDTAAEEDSSFQGRVVMWKYAVNLTEDYPIMGGGFLSNYYKPYQARFMPFGHEPLAYHSVYFEVLGEHGYVGLFLFLTIIFTSWFSAGTTYSILKQHKDLMWLADMAKTLRLSVLAYSVGGLTVNISTLDYFYDMSCLIILVHIIGMKILSARETTESTFNPFDVKEKHLFHKEQEREIVEEDDKDNPYNLRPKKKKKKWSPHGGDG
ncbi:putative O-glycosylation ligase, exosortase A system-associated [Temperatibacter marinus]|uniref:O-glycosylation ligase, exosortase A system-associated n=1 Tax=Temperatibacter marinus TaxID=1456591 RepID=A0AA52H9W9_9PROT|nr:putative O-glycosylation ligase, exosortase A system-associated [Temperatibacter marinus]WND03354.1 putative O-glycosylation ligase, exosortase A system-associated [Temperatibacter marinus]